ncbi:hypothetical protein H3V11_08195 [Snodgrassella sp. W8158]|nr:hypothetical protein [Snodgrassella sp. W8158]MBI0181919.1 hypothetical protein [Snodgrassella sp. W8158]
MARSIFVFESHEEAYKALKFLKRAIAEKKEKELKQKEETQRASKADTSN